MAVCHVVRYTIVTQKIKQLFDQGAIGDIVSVQRLEPVGYWHQAHSFVRGNWRNEEESSAMLLAKSCHDVDWLRYIVGVPCKKGSSFGNLKHFRAEQKPVAAAARCLDCGLVAGVRVCGAEDLLGAGAGRADRLAGRCIDAGRG